jgi:xylulose-5-phosphate/fructose-6-phosphate phosphoketolase
LNDLDRFHLVMDVIDRVPELGHLAADTRQAMQDKRVEHKAYIAKHGDDQPDIRDWKWDAARSRALGHS